MMIRSGSALIALGKIFLRIAGLGGHRPSSSIPVKEKIAIWKPARKPVTPWA
ncbi:Uncharacterised protein [Raoultella terrigena]|uniref:Uncharacterized protein n=1 Tax=Raoultella terrigena TaxID=577 RepID=A0A3P8M3R0_RAOTE|nr:Uncharacterised protein [Raoultella terrigena]